MNAAERLARHNRCQLEAMADADELRQAALEGLAAGNGWPRRRFRVECSRAGNSALTIGAAAQRLQQRVGGKVVEVIPSWSEMERRRKAAAKAARRCPCGEACEVVDYPTGVRSCGNVWP